MWDTESHPPLPVCSSLPAEATQGDGDRCAADRFAPLIQERADEDRNIDREVRNGYRPVIDHRVLLRTDEPDQQQPVRAVGCVRGVPNDRPAIGIGPVRIRRDK